MTGRECGGGEGVGSQKKKKKKKKKEREREREKEIMSLRVLVTGVGADGKMEVFRYWGLCPTLARGQPPSTPRREGERIRLSAPPPLFLRHTYTAQL